MQAFYFQPVSVTVEHLAKLGRHLIRFNSWQDGPAVVECFALIYLIDLRQFENFEESKSQTFFTITQKFFAAIFL